ncbi:dihydrodipicolinate synthase [Bradyrhizobium sp. CCBAU 11386]|uniref:dihydrodipicolinate synthase family protein n=1 Tax=Bradyrhizobium sp. CCBAU 11386 TaxID=1630837 RepID=UPI00230217C9|nr:dihydrodipicolinate synthase family protein [Bradyrhizobium sp. CCBAU 11386]MDA9510669.1 dihydrodipicolinate synthase [Bradyrhizobium sp. CCBAU 11386]
MSKPMKKPDLRGVTVATVLPFKDDSSIDWDGYGRVLDYCACPDGIAAVFVNGHAGEGGSLSDDERQAVIERTRRQIGCKPLLAGIIAHSTAEAIHQAQLAEAAGADCAVLFPPAPLGGGASATSRAPVAFVQAVSSAIGIPVSIFQYPLASGFGYSPETLAKIAALDSVIAIKEGSDTIFAYDENRRAVKQADPTVAILPSNFNWFLPQLAVGGDGILSGLVSLAPDLFVALWQAALVDDLTAMRAVNERLYPIVRAIYGPAPIMDMHTRMKVGLKALGLIRNADPRPPLLPVVPALCDVIATTVGAARAVGDIRLA